MKQGLNRETDIGEAIAAVVRSVDPKQYAKIPVGHLHARAAGRMLEEAVELALAFGLPPAGVMAHVMDAIHNECKKAGQYPGSFKPAKSDQVDILVELSDGELQIEHLRHLAGITRSKLDNAVFEKLVKLRTWANDGEMSMVDGLMYRRGVRNVG